MSIFDKIKRQARKLMPKELSGIAQIAAPFVAGGGNPFLAMALSAAGQARSGRGDINPLKVALSGAPGFAYGKGAYFGDDRTGILSKLPIGSLENAENSGTAGSSLRNILTGYGTGERGYGDNQVGGILGKDFGKTADRFIFGGKKYKSKKFPGDEYLEAATDIDGNIIEGKYLTKRKPSFYKSVGTEKAGLFGATGGDPFKLSSLKDSALANAAFKQGNPFDTQQDISLLKLGSEALTIYSFLDARKEIKTAEEAAAAVEAQMLADGITDQNLIDAATTEAVNIFSQLSLADFNLANGGRIGFARGTPEEGIGSLDTGAESITYEGTDGARSPEQTENEQQNLQAMGIPRGLSLEDAIKTFEMSIGRPPKGIEEVLEFFKNRKLSGGTPLPEDPTKPINPFGPKPMKDGITQMAAAGGRMGFMYGSDMNNMGGLSSLQTQPSDVTPPGMELDLRGGGFIPIGKAEKADDVPARVSKNEFVFTADAVKAAGGGSVNEGAKKMYDTMKQLESQVG